jgi:hypothetical protein
MARNERRFSLMNWFLKHPKVFGTILFMISFMIAYSILRFLSK